MEKEQYAVLHIEKGNISSGGIGNHIDRIEGFEHSYPHADPKRKHLNKNFELNEYCSMPLHEAIEKRIKDGYKVKAKNGQLKAIRKDAVKYLTHILTGSHEQMKALENNHELLNDWIEENKKFIEDEFGKDNIVRFVIHRDEKTPHIHAVTVPLTPDGRLSAKNVIGERKGLIKLQDNYAVKMERFNLNRGLKDVGIKHEDAKQYYKRVNKEIDDFQTEVEKIKKSKNLEINLLSDKLEKIIKEKDDYISRLIEENSDLSRGIAVLRIDKNTSNRYIKELTKDCENLIFQLTDESNKFTEEIKAKDCIIKEKNDYISRLEDENTKLKQKTKTRIKI